MAPAVDIRLATIPTVAAFSAHLNRGTRFCAIGAEDTAIAVKGFGYLVAQGTLPEELAGIRRHRLRRQLSAIRTSYRRLQFYF